MKHLLSVAALLVATWTFTAGSAPCRICGPPSANKKCRPSAAMTPPKGLAIQSSICNEIESKHKDYHKQLCEKYPKPNGYYFECTSPGTSNSFSCSSTCGPALEDVGKGLNLDLLQGNNLFNSFNNNNNRKNRHGPDLFSFANFNQDKSRGIADFGNFATAGGRGNLNLLNAQNGRNNFQTQGRTTNHRVGANNIGDISTAGTGHGRTASFTSSSSSSSGGDSAGRQQQQRNRDALGAVNNVLGQLGTNKGHQSGGSATSSSTSGSSSGSNTGNGFGQLGNGFNKAAATSSSASGGTRAGGRGGGTFHAGNFADTRDSQKWFDGLASPIGKGRVSGSSNTNHAFNLPGATHGTNSQPFNFDTNHHGTLGFNGAYGGARPANVNSRNFNQNFNNLGALKTVDNQQDFDNYFDNFNNNFETGFDSFLPADRKKLSGGGAAAAGSARHAVGTVGKVGGAVVSVGGAPAAKAFGGGAEAPPPVVAVPVGPAPLPVKGGAANPGPILPDTTLPPISLQGAHAPRSESALQAPPPVVEERKAHAAKLAPPQEEQGEDDVDLGGELEKEEEEQAPEEREEDVKISPPERNTSTEQSDLPAEDATLDVVPDTAEDDAEEESERTESPQSRDDDSDGFDSTAKDSNDDGDDDGDNLPPMRLPAYHFKADDMDDYHDDTTTTAAPTTTTAAPPKEEKTTSAPMEEEQPYVYHPRYLYVPKRGKGEKPEEEEDELPVPAGGELIPDDTKNSDNESAAVIVSVESLLDVGGFNGGVPYKGGPISGGISGAGASGPPPLHQVPPTDQYPSPNQAPPANQGSPVHQAQAPPLDHVPPVNQVPPANQAPPFNALPTNQYPPPNQAPPVNPGPPGDQPPRANQVPPFHREPPADRAPPFNRNPSPSRAPPANEAPPFDRAPPPGQPRSVNEYPSPNQVPSFGQGPPPVNQFSSRNQAAGGQFPGAGDPRPPLARSPPDAVPRENPDAGSAVPALPVALGGGSPPEPAAPFPEQARPRPAVASDPQDDTLSVASEGDRPQPALVDSAPKEAPGPVPVSLPSSLSASAPTGDSDSSSPDLGRAETPRETYPGGPPRPPHPPARASYPPVDLSSDEAYPPGQGPPKASNPEAAPRLERYATPDPDSDPAADGAAGADPGPRAGDKTGPGALDAYHTASNDRGPPGPVHTASRAPSRDPTGTGSAGNDGKSPVVVVDEKRSGKLSTTNPKAAGSRRGSPPGIFDVPGKTSHSSNTVHAPKPKLPPESFKNPFKNPSARGFGKRRDQFESNPAFVGTSLFGEGFLDSPDSPTGAHVPRGPDAVDIGGNELFPGFQEFEKTGTKEVLGLNKNDPHQNNIFSLFTQPTHQPVKGSPAQRPAPNNNNNGLGSLMGLGQNANVFSPNFMSKPGRTNFLAPPQQNQASRLGPAYNRVPAGSGSYNSQVAPTAFPANPSFGNAGRSTRPDNRNNNNQLPRVPPFGAAGNTRYGHGQGGAPATAGYPAGPHPGTAAYPPFGSTTSGKPGSPPPGGVRSNPGSYPVGRYPGTAAFPHFGSTTSGKPGPPPPSSGGRSNPGSYYPGGAYPGTAAYPPFGSTTSGSNPGGSRGSGGSTGAGKHGFRGFGPDNKDAFGSFGSFGGFNNNGFGDKGFGDNDQLNSNGFSEDLFNGKNAKTEESEQTIASNPAPAPSKTN